jgi:hypothetical protein
MGERYAGPGVPSAEIGMSRPLPALVLGIVLVLVLIVPTQAQAARCSPTEFYRPSIRVCEAKAGNPLYRARRTAKKVKTVRAAAQAHKRSAALSKAAGRARQAPLAQPIVAPSEAKAIPLAVPEPRDAPDTEIAGFEARWSPVRGMSHSLVSATDGVRRGEGQNATEAGH